jgi:hypothetical protein
MTALDDETEANVNGSPVDASASVLTPEQLQAYLENLRPEDFGKFSP